jgi:cytoskeletal protein RodZ
MTKNNQIGFMVIEPVLVLLIIGLVGFTGWFVLHAKHSANLSLNNAAASHPVAPLTDKTSTKQIASSDSPGTVSSTASNPSPKTATTKTSTNGTPVAPTPTPIAAQTPLSVLTAIIADLEKGISANVTLNSVTVPGPIGNATARPLVFTFDGQQYFAYTQGTAPNFSLTAAQTANTMAIVKATVNNPPLITAYIDKSNNLTDPNFHLDGFSTGGN